MGVDAYNINGRKKLIGMAAGKKMTDGHDNGGDDVGKTRRLTVAQLLPHNPHNHSA